MSNIRRIPFYLNLDDPDEAALFEALQPLLNRRKSSQFIRGLLYAALGVNSLFTAVQSIAPKSSAPTLGLGLLAAGDDFRAKRPTPKATLEDVPIDDGNDENALESATGNFLNMFG